MEATVQHHLGPAVHIQSNPCSGPSPFCPIKVAQSRKIPNSLPPELYGAMDDLDLRMEDLPMEDYAPNKLQSPMREHKKLRRSQSLTMYMDLDDPSDLEGDSPRRDTRLKSGCLILCCAQCLSAVLIEYSNGTIPGLPRPSKTSRNHNGVALTDCKKCFWRTRKGLEGRAQDNRGHFRMSRTASMCPSLWDTSDLIGAANLVLGEAVGIMLVDRVCLHMSWDRVSRAFAGRDRVTSLDVSQAATRDVSKIVLPYLTGNWV